MKILTDEIIHVAKFSNIDIIYSLFNTCKTWKIRIVNYEYLICYDAFKYITGSSRLSKTRKKIRYTRKLISMNIFKNIIINNLAEVNDYKSIKRIILNDDLCNYENIDFFINVVSIVGDIPLIKKLLKNTYINPNDALINAVNCGHYDAVSILIKDYRIHHEINDNLAIKTAVFLGNYDIVKLLLTDPCVDLFDTLPLCDDIKIANLLLGDSRLPRHENIAEYAISLIRGNYIDEFKKLIDSELDISKHENYSMIRNYICYENRKKEYLKIINNSYFEKQKQKGIYTYFFYD